MSQINFSVAHEILRSLDDYGNDELFKEEYAYFMNHMSGRMKKMLVDDSCSFLKVVEMLKKDARELEEGSFIKGMKEFVSRYYKFMSEYQGKRSKLEIGLFTSGESIEPEPRGRLTSARKVKEDKSVDRFK